jgi:hypothetical protein
MDKERQSSLVFPGRMIYMRRFILTFAVLGLLALHPASAAAQNNGFSGISGDTTTVAPVPPTAPAAPTPPMAPMPSLPPSGAASAPAQNNAVPNIIENIIGGNTSAAPAAAAPQTIDAEKIDPCAAYVGNYNIYASCQDRHQKLERMKEAKEKRAAARKKPEPAPVAAPEIQQPAAQTPATPDAAQPTATTPAAATPDDKKTPEEQAPHKLKKTYKAD